LKIWEKYYCIWSSSLIDISDKREQYPQKVIKNKKEKIIKIEYASMPIIPYDYETELISLNEDDLEEEEQNIDLSVIIYYNIVINIRKFFFPNYEILKRM